MLKTFETNYRLDPIRLPRKGIWRPLSLQTSLSIGSLPHFVNSNHAESMLSVIPDWTQSGYLANQWTAPSPSKPPSL